MRTPRTHATRALDAVRRRHRRGRAGRPARGAARRRLSWRRRRARIDHALRIIDALPPVRVELVDAASARLAAGERPSSEAIADRVVRDSMCDLLA